MRYMILYKIVITSVMVKKRKINKTVTTKELLPASSAATAAFAYEFQQLQQLLCYFCAFQSREMVSEILMPIVRPTLSHSHTYVCLEAASLLGWHLNYDLAVL